MLVFADAPLQVTVIGQLPGVVFAPTLHVQETFPAALEVAGPRPAAVAGPDL